LLVSSKYSHFCSIWKYTDKNREKIVRKRQNIFPSFLRVRIFLSKLANNLPIMSKIFSFWENQGRIFCLFLHIFLWFLSVYCYTLLTEHGVKHTLLWWCIYCWLYSHDTSLEKVWGHFSEKYQIEKTYILYFYHNEIFIAKMGRWEFSFWEKYIFFNTSHTDKNREKIIRKRQTK